MTAVAHSHPGHRAAWVDGEPLDVADVETELARLRSGPRAGLLPIAESSEGRQLRRWVAQSLVARRLLEQQADRLGLGADADPGVEQVVPSRMAAMCLGGVLASVLRQSGPARVVYAAVTAAVRVPDEDVRAYLARASGNPNPVAWGDACSLLGEARRREAFLDWYAVQTSTRVRLEHGYEHPGDPHQPDATHRH
jgi:[acyl-carrier-protein] S-malonyltransferase